jgi:hypothetical protein
MENREQGAPPFVQVAEVEVDAVQPGRSGFVLDGRGADGADYRLELHLDLPVDHRTQQVLAGLLAQSEWRIARRVTPSAPGQPRRARSRRPGALGQSDST